MKCDYKINNDTIIFYDKCGNKIYETPYIVNNIDIYGEVSKITTKNISIKNIVDDFYFIKKDDTKLIFNNTIKYSNISKSNIYTVINYFYTIGLENETNSVIYDDINDKFYNDVVYIETLKTPYLIYKNILNYYCVLNNNSDIIYKIDNSNQKYTNVINMCSNRLFLCEKNKLNIYDIVKDKIIAEYNGFVLNKFENFHSILIEDNNTTIVSVVLNEKCDLIIDEDGNDLLDGVDYDYIDDDYIDDDYMLAEIYDYVDVLDFILLVKYLDDDDIITKISYKDLILESCKIKNLKHFN